MLNTKAKAMNANQLKFLLLIITTSTMEQS